MSEHVTCPSCGGAGGGPFGPAGSAWDNDEYECPRCRGIGAIANDVRPGIAKGVVKAAPAAASKKTGTTDN